MGKTGLIRQVRTKPVRPIYYTQMYAPPIYDKRPGFSPHMADGPVHGCHLRICFLIYNIKVRARKILGSTMCHFVLRDATLEHKLCNCRAQNETARSTEWRTAEHKMRHHRAKRGKTPCNERGGSLQSIFK